MKKLIFLLAILASFCFLSAQNLVLQSQEPSFTTQGVCEPQEQTRADAVLKYIVGDPSNALGTSAYTGTRYTSGCINFTQGQMYNYVGATLHQINVGVAAASSMANMTGYKIWIKTAMDGAIVYEQNITPLPTLGTTYAWKEFTLTTPYIITNAPLVIGFTATFTSATSAGFFPLACSMSPDTYKPGGFNYINASTNANAHGTGASWNQYTGAGNLAIAALLTNVPQIPANDLAATNVKSDPLKWVGGPQSTYTVTIVNTGTASQNNYTVELINDANAVLATKAVTTALAAGASTDVTLNYTPATVGNLVVRGKVVLTGDEVSGNNISDPLSQKIYAMQPMAYCTYAIENGIGPSTPPATAHAAINYTAANMTPFVGKFLTSIDLAISPGGSISNAVLWIRNARDGANLYSQNFTPVSGWNSIALTTPYPLTSANTFIGYSVDVASGNPLGASMNPMVSNVNHVGINTNWYDLSQVLTQGNGNMSIIGVVSNSATDVIISTAVNPVGAGSVTGGGSYAVGAPVSLTATANAGYAFEKWTPGNSTANPLTFNATANATYTANFIEVGPDCDPAKNINVVYSTDCSKATITWDPPAKGGKSPLIHASNSNLKDCAELRSTTPAIPVITQDDFKRTDPSRAILFNNGPLITHPGAGPGGVDVSAINDPYSTLYGSNVNKTLNYSIAEDFTLDAQSTIENFNFFSYQTNAGSTTSTITGAYVRIWSGEPGICGSTVIWGDLTTNRMASTNYSSINRVSIPTDGLTGTARRIMNVIATVNTVLNPGIYWVEWTLTGSLSSGPWSPPVSVLGSPETGNAKQFNGTKWQPCSAEQGGVHAMAFIVNGTPTGTNKLIPKAPTPFTATPVGTQYKCNLQWTNPSIAFGGAPLTSITKMVLERDCEVIQEFTTATVGGVMNYTDNVPGNGVYTYSLYAVTPDGNGPRAFVTAFVGDPCSAEVIISGLDTYLDAWSWILYDVRSGYVYKGGGAESGKGGLSAGTHAANIYGDAKFEMWQHGTAGDNTALVTVKLDGVIVYQKTTPAIPVGFTANAALPCAGDPNPYDITYNVYRDDVKIASDIEATTFEDKTFDKNKPYTWKVVVNCPNGEESDPISKSLAACYTPLPPCKPVKNVNGVFNTETKEVTVTWTAPEGNITPTGYKLFIGDAEPLEVTALTYKHDVSALAPGEYEYEYCVLPVYATGVCEGTVAKECKKVPFEILGIKGYTTTFSIAPNPANDFIIIKAKGDFNNIEVLSFLGQVVLAQSNEGNSAKVDIANLTNGVYFVRITSDTGTSVQKFVKN